MQCRQAIDTAAYEAARLRKEKLTLRRSMSETQRRAASREIAASLMQLSCWQTVESLLCYVSYETEVSTKELLLTALQEKKRVFCPKVEADGRMEFYRIRSLAELTPGYHGILEPKAVTERYAAGEAFAGKEALSEAETLAEAEASEAAEAAGAGRKASRPSGNASAGTLLLAPGTVFDPYGHRIGYGGGYYDRWLARFTKEERPCCIGLCFACQMTETIVPGKHDVPMDWVLTQKGRYYDGFTTDGAACGCRKICAGRTDQ